MNNSRFKKQILTAVLVGIVIFSNLLQNALIQAQKLNSTSKTALSEDKIKERRLKWFREARFGMMIHWGLYSVPEGEWKGKPIPGLGEWIMNRAKIPVIEYEQLAKQFNPVKFDAEEIVRVAKNAGMKYIVITSKHHDGFAMYHSAVSKYNIYDATPFKRDPMKELSVAAKSSRSPPKKPGSNSVFITRRRRIGTNPTRSATTGISPTRARKILPNI
jgi:hypothetical protein